MKTESPAWLRTAGVLMALALALAPRAAAAEPEDEYARIYALIQEADTLGSSQPAQALTRYKAAQTALQQFQKLHPDWNRRVVSYRLNYLEFKIGPALTNSPPAVTPPVPARGPAAPSPAVVGGLFPKMPPATKVYVVDCEHDFEDARMAAWVLQGLINRDNAEVYVIEKEPGRHLEQLQDCGKPYERLDQPAGANSGWRALFRKYRGRVKKLWIYDLQKDWTWYLALMSAAQRGGIPVTEPLRNDLRSEFGWTGEVEDLRNRWTNRIAAYDWALTNLMPGCNKRVVFATSLNTALFDYAVASQGFAFWLDFDGERAEVQKIFRAGGYGVGTSLMGYANTGDLANEVSNPFGFGYVASDLYANGSFWSSFPNRTYTQAPGRAVKALPGKIYASIMWSDGDNLQFDQNALWNLWHDPARGTIPVATALAPALQEVNTPLLDWYYSRMTGKDELVAGPTGFQFIHIRDFNDRLFPAWCALTRAWCAGAGFHSARIWLAPFGSAKYFTYMKTTGLDGVLGEGWVAQPGLPPKIGTYAAMDEEELFKQFLVVAPDPRKPVFVNFTPIVAGIYQGGRGYSAVKRQMDRLDRAYPDRYVFLLPKDQFATIRSYYRLGGPVAEYAEFREITGRSGADEGLTPVSAGDSEFATETRDGTNCWRVPKHEPPRFFYLAMDGRFWLPPRSRLEIELEYLDSGSGDIVFEYDSTDVDAPLGGAYKKHPDTVHRADTGRGQVARFGVNDANFAGRQNGRADFRFYCGGDDLWIRAVRVRRAGP
jgi:hypothetical protein